MRQSRQRSIQPGDVIQHANVELAKAVEIIAHRGASHDAPENTLSSVNLAWERDADAVEIDVYLSKDRRIVTYHDKTTERIGGRKRATEDQTLAELRQLDVGSWKDPKYTGEKIPTLEQILETVPAKKRLFIEVKSDERIIPVLVRLLKSWKHTKDRAVVIAFSYDVAKGIKAILPELPVYWLVAFEQSKDTGQWSPSVEHVVREARAAKVDGINVNACDFVNAQMIKKVRKADLGFFVWTVNEPEIAHRMVRLGVDGITTDRPKWLKERLQPIK